MKRFWGVAWVLLLSAMAFARSGDDFPGTLKNARYVYVTAYDGPEFSHNLLPEDRQAIAAVQEAIQKWGKYIVVYEPGTADMILAVERRGSEDVLAVYDAKSGPDSQYLWRVMGRGGLDKNEMPLFRKFQEAVEKLGTKTSGQVRPPAPAASGFTG
jgi:hypothetical protein